MIKALIIEDEKDSREAIISLLQLVSKDIEVIGEAANVKDGINLIDQNKFDILFLDIDLHGGTGFNVLEGISNRDFNLVFTTAHNDHAVKAFRYSAIDYLLKPIDPGELSAAIQKVKEKKKMDSIENKVQLLFENFHQKKFERMSFPTIDGFEIIPTQDIILFSAESNYTNVHLKSGKKILVTKTIKVYEDLLSNAGFFRVHQSHLVNLSYIVKYNNADGGSVTLSDNTVVYVARRKKESLLKELKNTL